MSHSEKRHTRENLSYGFPDQWVILHIFKPTTRTGRIFTLAITPHIPRPIPLEKIHNSLIMDGLIENLHG